MKRTSLLLLLTLLLPGPPIGGQSGRGDLDIVVERLHPRGPGGGRRLCAGTGNAIQAELAMTGARPAGAVLLELALVVPGGDGAGLPLGRGSIWFSGSARSASFTFVNVEVPARLRGRGARLEVRANLDRAAGERTLANNIGTIVIDEATDWQCAAPRR